MNNINNKIDLGVKLVALYIIVEYVRPMDLIPVLRPVKIGLVISIVVFVYFLSKNKLKFDILFLYLTLWIVVLAKSIFFATNWYWATVTTRDLLFLFLGLCIPLVNFTINIKSFEYIIHAFIISNVALAIYSISHGGVGPGSFVGDENDLALSLIVSLPFIVFIMFHKKNKLLYLVGIVVVLLGIVVTMSRGGFIGLVAVILYSWYTTKQKLKYFFITSFIIIILLPFVPQKYWNEVQSISTSQEETGGARLYTWGVAWDMFIDNPIMGVGGRNFQWNVVKYDNEGYKGRRYGGRAAHSLYFTLLPELGIPGVILFILFIAAFFKNTNRIINYFRSNEMQISTNSPPYVLRQQRKKFEAFSMALKTSLVGFLVTGTFISVLYYTHFWLLLVLSLALKNTFLYEYNSEKMIIENN